MLFKYHGQCQHCSNLVTVFCNFFVYYVTWTLRFTQRSCKFILHIFSSCFVAYELWFKQIIHELDSIREMFTIEQLVQVLLSVFQIRLFFSSSYNYVLCVSMQTLLHLNLLSELPFRINSHWFKALPVEFELAAAPCSLAFCFPDCLTH